MSGGGWYNDPAFSGGGTYDPNSPNYPVNGTAAEQSAWMKAHGYGTGQNTGPNSLLPPGWVINPETGGLIPPGPGDKGGGGIPIGGFFDVNGTVYQWNGHGSLVQASVGETKSYWNQHPNGLSYNPAYGLLDAGGQGVTNNYGGGTSGSGGSGGYSQRLSTDDPRYWDLEYAKLNSSDKQAADQLAYQYTQLGMTGENARRSALMAFIQARDSLASNTAQTSANIAEAKAKFAANPRDTYAEGIYRGEVGGSTPFGDLNNSAFGEYGKALAAKVGSTFEGVDADLAASRRYRDALPLQDWLPADLRGSSNAGQPTGSPAASAPAGAVGTASSVNPLSAFAGATPQQLSVINQIADQQNPLRSFVGATPEQLAAIRQIAAQRAGSQQPSQGGGGMSPPPSWSTGGLPAPTAGGPTAPPSFIQQPTEGLLGPTVGKVPTSVGGTLAPTDYTRPVPFARGGHIHVNYGNITGSGFGSPGAFAQGGQVDVGPDLASRVGNLTRFGEGHQPSSSEGGLQLNIHELAHIVGQSGHVYASLGEGGYPEQVKITPTASGKKAAQAAEKAGKSLSGTMKNNAAQGGTASVDPSLDEMNDQYSQLLARLGGQGGGSNTPYGGARFLAGAPWQQIQQDPYLSQITHAGYSIRGVPDNELDAEVQKFTPQGITNNSPRVNFT